MGPRIFKGKMMIFLVIFLVFIAAMVAYSTLTRKESFVHEVLLVTSMGNVTIGLYDDMPITAGNFLNLTRSGIYDNTIFHRVVANFVVQGGDPTGTGKGDPNIPTIPDELPNRHSNVLGNVAMAKTAEANSASSQFYINLKDNSADLDSNYSVFGKVTNGMDVVQAIGRVETSQSTELQDRPIVDVKLIKAIVLK